MPSKYVVRSFAKDNYYHVFNRGIESKKIFKEEKDYRIFLYYMFVYLSSPNKIQASYPQIPINLQTRNLNRELSLLAYCLMPNHFHFLFKQLSSDAISKFMKQLINAYTLYFNNKYNRIGSLFQGRFKAVLIGKDEVLLHISRYIHLNPLVAKVTDDIENYQWSSLKDYLSGVEESLCKKEIILGYFPKLESYKNFTLDQVEYAKSLNKIKHQTMD